MDLPQNPLVIIFLLVLFLSMFLMIISHWILYEKTGRPGWVSIIPVYNFVVLLEIVGKPAGWIILFFIPVVNIIVYFIVLYNLAKAFGRDGSFALGLILLPFVFYPILAFGNSSYTQPQQPGTNLVAAVGGKLSQTNGSQATQKVAKKRNLLLIILILILLIILAGIANHYIRINRGCPYNNRKIHYSFNTGCGFVAANGSWDPCTQDGTCRTFETPNLGILSIGAQPAEEVLISQYANIKERSSSYNLQEAFGDMSEVNLQAIDFTYYFSEKKLIEKIAPFVDRSIYKEVELEPFLINKNGIIFYQVMNRYCAAGDVYSVCFHSSQNTLESEKEMVKELNTFKFN